MISLLHQFQDRIDQLLSFLDDAELINDLVGSNVHAKNKKHVKPDIWSRLVQLKTRNTERRVQTYVTSIILLYGLFEQYVEELLVAYLDELNSTIKNFDDMPDSIKKNHTTYSATLLTNMNLDKYRDRCNEKEIMHRMLSCLENESYQINSIAFIEHKSNFRLESLNQFFVPIGISGLAQRIKQTEAFRGHIERKFQDQNVDNLPDKVVFADLDDLTWRRNVVAHRWPDDTLSVEMVKERAEFVRTLGESIHEVLRQDLTSHIVKHLCCALPAPIAVYNNSIVCFHLESDTVSQGLRIIARRPNKSYIEGKIIRIEVDRVERAEVIPPADVACLVDFKAKINYEYFLINNID